MAILKAACENRNRRLNLYTANIQLLLSAVRAPIDARDDRGGGEAYGDDNRHLSKD